MTIKKEITLIAFSSLILTSLSLLYCFSFIDVSAQTLNEGETLGSDTSLKTYRNSDLGISIQLPSDWQPEDGKKSVKIIREKEIVFIDIRVNQPRSPLTDITQYAIEDLNSRKGNRLDFKLLSSEAATISGGSAYKAIYSFSKSGSQNGIGDKILRYWVSNNNLIYTIAYVSEEDKYDLYLTEAQNIIESIRFGNTSEQQNIGPIVGDQNESISSEQPSIDFGSNNESQLSKNNEFFSYQNESLRLSLAYPSTWQREDFTNGVRFISPNENESDTYRETFEVSVFSPGSLGFLPLGNLSSHEVGNGFISYYNRTLSNLELISSESTSLGGDNEARLYILRYLDQNTGLTQALNIFTVNSGDIFVVSYYANPGSYSKYLPIITMMILSMHILPPPMTVK